ncbi:MAG: PaaI family thioesterase [Bacteroidota bacterium]
MNKELLDSMQKLSGKNDITIPPLSSIDMESEILEYKTGESLKVSFPIKEKYNNPMNVTLGGYFSVFFDLTFGPFSFMEIQGPTTSLDLNVSFIKPVAPADKNIIIEAKIVSKSKTFINFEGKAFKEDGTLLASSTSRMMVIKLKQD